MRFLFIKSALEYPRRSGHDVHCYSMMRELSAQGHAIGMITDVEVSDAAIAGVSCDYRITFGRYQGNPGPVKLTKLQERFRSYWGISQRSIAVVAEAANAWDADVVVVVGLDVLPYLAGVSSSKRVWYAADEWFLHHASLIFPTKPASWRELKPAIVKGLYERAYANCVDRVWVVSERDARAVRWVMGTKVDVAANGVDSQYYRRVENVTPKPESCVFWGRLDFAPNIDAIEWFCENVWHHLRSELPTCRFSVYGFSPTDQVQTLANQYHFDLMPDMPDIRTEVAKSQVVVLPFVSGAGIKNKLLEAAAMSMPIVASPRVIEGLQIDGKPPVLVANRPNEWRDALKGIWKNACVRNALGDRAREWVTGNYSWRQAADAVIPPLEDNA